MSNQFKFVKMNQFMVVKCGESYDRFSVVATKEATHDWKPSKFLDRKENQGEKFDAQFDALWNHQNNPVIDEQYVTDALFWN